MIIISCVKEDSTTGTRTWFFRDLFMLLNISVRHFIFSWESSSCSPPASQRLCSTSRAAHAGFVAFNIGMETKSNMFHDAHAPSLFYNSFQTIRTGHASQWWYKSLAAVCIGAQQGNYGIVKNMFAMMGVYAQFHICVQTKSLRHLPKWNVTNIIENN